MPNDDASSSGSDTSSSPVASGRQISSSSGGGVADASRWRLSLDLTTAARWHLTFLSSISTIIPFLPHRRTLQRYQELWLPLMAELYKGSLSAPLLLPPPDVDWVWHCHCLTPAKYRDYCASRFGFLIDRPAIFDEENQDYAAIRCREIWELRYPPEPFDLEMVDKEENETSSCGGGEIATAAERFRALYEQFSDPFVYETVYLVAARSRYLRFLDFVSGFGDGALRVVPASDILLMWLTHQSFPARYKQDMEGFGNVWEKIVGFGDPASQEEVNATSQAWEEAFDEPYERAGISLDPPCSPSRAVFNWASADADVNRRYKGLLPRAVLVVNVFLKGHWQGTEKKDFCNKFVRLRTIRCHGEFKLDLPVAELSSDMWRKRWHLFCEFGTRGVAIEVRQQGSGCLRKSKTLKRLIFLWNDLLRANSLTLTKELDLQVKALSSITPPVQAPYLLKCVSDRVTDDSGAMISDEVLKRNRYRPQEGRWITRTVLDHAGRECFVVRIRVGKGFWRLGAETPSPVKWEERIIEVREGPWKYIGSSVGFAPEKVVGTAMPKKDESEDRKTIWSLSTGDVLKIQYKNGLDILLESDASTEMARFLRGRKLQYQLKDVYHCEKVDEQDDDYLTLVRYSSENPAGRATALLNWKLLAMEFLPEEDAVVMLLLSMAIVKTISEITSEDVAGLLVRKRSTEVRVGNRDWGSIILPPSPNLSPHLQPWYINADEVLAPAKVTNSREYITRNSPADGKDVLYKQAIMS